MPDITATKPADAAPVDTAWGQQVHDAVEGIQAGQVSGSTGTGTTLDVTVTFPRPYAAPPFIAITSLGAPTNLAASSAFPTTTTCVVRFFKRDGTAFSAGTAVYANWVAIGTPA